MKIKGKYYCDVCLKELNYNEVHIITGALLDDNIDEQQRHYCHEHRVWSELWHCIKNGEDVGKLEFPNKAEKKENVDLEVYDTLSALFVKWLSHITDMSCLDKDIKEHTKTSMNADVAYSRLKLRGIIKEEEKFKY